MSSVFLVYFVMIKNMRSHAVEKIAERLSWCTARRDQSGMAKDLAERKDISEI
jgi:hypothetical protein